MDNETVAAASSAEVEDVFKGEQVSMDEFTRYRKDGELPDRFKPAQSESATDDAQEETEATEDEDPEPEPASEPEEPQGLKPKTAKRIEQLLAEKKELQRQLAEKQVVKPESTPVSEPPPTRLKPTAEDKKEDGSSKYETYEDFVEELTDWRAEQREVKNKREEQAQTQARSFLAKVDEARTRYPSFDEVVQPAATAINTDVSIPQVVKQMLMESDVLPDFLFTVGSDPAELAKFVKMARETPGKAIRFIAMSEDLITKELEEANPSGKEAPVKPKTTAPKPPSPVGGASSRAFDVNDESLSADEWARKRTQDIQKKRS